MSERMILVVAPRAVDRERLALWLEGPGREVLTCPGPTGADACLGLRGPRCPLAGVADLIVLDLVTTGPGVAGWQLLDAYLGLGLAVVGLMEPGEGFLARPGGRMIPLPGDAPRAELEDAVARGLASRLATLSGPSS